MLISRRDQERPLIHVAAGLARARRARGLQLNYPDDAPPDIRVEPDTFTVRIDGEVIEEAPATELPMAQRWFLF
jgi:urease subunit alpha